MLTTLCKKRLLGLSSLLFLSIPVYAASGHFYAGTSLGGTFTQLSNGTPTIIYNSNQLIDAYPLNHTHQGSTVAGVTGGYEWQGTGWMPAVALGMGVYTNPVDIGYNGQLIETPAGDPSMLLYNYTYNVNTTRVMAEAQFNWIMPTVSPFINIGVGPAWTRMSGYTETPATSNGFTALPAFQSRTNVNAAYQVGVGVSTGFNLWVTDDEFKHDRISLGYRYVNLGNTYFNRRGSVYPYQLNTGRLTANDVYLSYTHLV